MRGLFVYVCVRVFACRDSGCVCWCYLYMCAMFRVCVGGCSSVRLLVGVCVHVCMWLCMCLVMTLLVVSVSCVFRCVPV